MDTFSYGHLPDIYVNSVLSVVYCNSITKESMSSTVVDLPFKCHHLKTIVDIIHLQRKGKERGNDIPKKQT